MENIRRAVEEVGLDWQEANQHLDSADWKVITEQNQDEMVDGMGLWGGTELSPFGSRWGI